MVKKTDFILASRKYTGLGGLFLSSLENIFLILECPTELKDHLQCQRVGFKYSSDCHLNAEAANESL